MNANAAESQPSSSQSPREQARIFFVLRTIYVINIVIWIPFIIFDPELMARIAAVVIILFSFICLALIQLRRLTFPRYSASAMTILAASYFMLNGAGVKDGAVVMFPLAILLGALTVGRAGAVGAAILSFIAFSFVTAAESLQWFEPKFYETGGGDIFYTGMLFAGVTVTLWVIMGTMKADLRAAVDSEARYRLLADNVTDVVWVRDIETNLMVYCSPSIIKQRGYTPEEFMNLTPEEAIKPEYLTWAVSTLDEALANEISGLMEPGRWRTISYEVNCKDGSSIWVENLCSFIRDGNDNLQLLGVSRDITQRKADEKERDEVQKQVRSMQKMEGIGLLAGGIAHDFNNFLQGIVGNADIALTTLEDSHEGRENIEDLIARSEQAADLCRQLLAYAGKGKMKVEPVNLSTLVKEMADLLEVSISKKATLDLNLDPDLALVEVDATQIRQIVMNLIINASEAIVGNDGRIAITTTKQHCDRSYLDGYALDDEATAGMYVFLEVSDTGAGIDEATQTRIFDPFFTSKVTGHGLGLSAVLGIVRSHSGGIKVYSEVGIGTTFKIVLPATTKEAKAIEPVKTSHAPPPGEGIVLLADDEPTIRKMGRQALNARGYEVVTAADGKQALELYEEYGDRLLGVILDMTMPVMGGEEAYRRLRELNPDLPVIFSSGFNEQDTMNLFEGDGVSGFLQKPYRIADLVSLVSEAFHKNGRPDR